MKFTSLIQSIQQTHNALQQQAVKAINRSLTIRNWLIGFYIVEFEQKGEDRAEYGKRLMELLAKRLNNKSLSNGNLKVFRQFYLTYPQIRQSVIGFFNEHSPIRQSLIGELQANEMKGTMTAKFMGVKRQLLNLGPNYTPGQTYKQLIIYSSYSVTSYFRST